MEIIIQIISCFLLATIPASFSFFLDYCLGNPGSEDVKNNRIFSSYTLWISELTIGKKRCSAIRASYRDQIIHKDRSISAQGKRLYFLTVVSEAKDQFSFQQILGMCVFCSNFWISVFFTGMCFVELSFSYYAFTIPFFSHSILRKL